MKQINILTLFIVVGIILANGKETFQNASFILSGANGIGNIPVNQEFTANDSIKIGIKEPIVGLAISGKIYQNDINSFIRVLLEDNDGKQYTVLETCKLYNDFDTLTLSKYCEETIVLQHIIPSRLLFYLSNASLELDSVYFTYSRDNDRMTNKGYIDTLSHSCRLAQCESLVKRINDYNESHNKLWRAGVNELALAPWELRKKILGINGTCPVDGFEYYYSGIFEFGDMEPESSTLSLQSSPSPYVDTFDWRNRHGKNWLTPVKNQTISSGGCWAFATISVTEALVNLYYNQKVDYDLAEQEVISCSGAGTNANGGHPSSALLWVANNGVSEESSFPFSNSDEPCENKSNYNELISFNGRAAVQSYWGSNNDSIKKALIKYGPLCSGVQYITNSTFHGHAMALVGYSTLHAGDTIYLYYYNQSPNRYVVPENDERIGKTYWIFKNSYGPNNYHQGYIYVFFNSINSMITPYYAKTPVYSLLLNDNDILMSDADGDGYYCWGIGTKPLNCPTWVPDIQDGDDSNYSLGPINEFGYIYDLSAHVNDIVYINSDTTWNQKRYIYNNIIIPNGVTLRITDDVVFYNGARITLDGGTLHIDGGRLFEANISNASPSNVKVENSGSIFNASNKSFEVPLGTVLNFNSGIIQ